jgi:hypothetical protein
LTADKPRYESAPPSILCYKFSTAPPGSVTPQPATVIEKSDNPENLQRRLRNLELWLRSRKDRTNPTLHKMFLDKDLKHKIPVRLRRAPIIGR